MPSDPIQHLRELLAKATPGPLQGMQDSPFGALTVDGAWFCETGGSDQDEDNAALIVAAINALPALLAVAEAAAHMRRQAGEDGEEVSGIDQYHVRAALRRSGVIQSLDAIATLYEVKRP